MRGQATRVYPIAVPILEAHGHPQPKTAAGLRDHRAGDAEFHSAVRQPVAERFCIFGGIGYGYQSSVIEINGEPLCFGGREILFNCGIQAEWDPVIVTASYIHCLDRSTKAEYRSDVQKLHESDIGSLEARFEYRFSPTWGSSLSVETQLNRDTVIEKQFLIALGLTRRF